MMFFHFTVSLPPRQRFLPQHRFQQASTKYSCHVFPIYPYLGELNQNLIVTLLDTYSNHGYAEHTAIIAGIAYAISFAAMQIVIV